MSLVPMRTNRMVLQNASIDILSKLVFLLANASMPSKFWDEEFITATHLINMLLSRVINFETPTVLGNIIF